MAKMFPGFAVCNALDISLALHHKWQICSEDMMPASAHAMYLKSLTLISCLVFQQICNKIIVYFVRNAHNAE